MRLLADENVPRRVIESLVAAGHDVEWVPWSRAGASDPDLLALAGRERRVLLTFDKGFGELAVRRPRAATAGVVLVRMPSNPPDEVAVRLTRVFARHADWAGQVAVIEEKRIRVRTL
jgi:predicted nuclease of predicted toxin-antitoxin system